MNTKSMIKNIYNVVSWKRVIIVACFVLAYVLLLIPYVITIPFSIPGVDERINTTGILNDPQIGEDKEYWVNGAAARFFKKESIRIEWQDDLVTE